MISIKYKIIISTSACWPGLRTFPHSWHFKHQGCQSKPMLCLRSAEKNIVEWLIYLSCYITYEWHQIQANSKLPTRPNFRSLLCVYSVFECWCYDLNVLTDNIIKTDDRPWWPGRSKKHAKCNYCFITYQNRPAFHIYDISTWSCKLFISFFELYYIVVNH